MRRGYDEVVLLTGFPSFGARRMCEEIVHTTPRAFVHAIVPSAQEAAAREAREALPPDQRARVNLLEGDPTSIDLGLSGAEWKALAAEVDRIHHMATRDEVSSFANGDGARLIEAANVQGTREILELAEACSSLACLVFHSSAHVSGDRTGLVLEEELDKGQGFRNVAEETLARAEKLVRRAMTKVPACVVRPSIVVGDSRTGEVERGSGPYFLILLVVTSPPDFPLPLPGRVETPLHLVPIDYVVRAARAIGKDARAVGRTFHVADPSPLSAKRVIELVAEAGGRRTPRGFIPANLTKALLRTPGIDRFARSPRAFLDALATPVSYSLAGTTELLADGLQGHVRCPPFESYVEVLVEHVQQRLREKRARAAEVHDPLG
jgi:thioester reductase-like protein